VELNHDFSVSVPIERAWSVLTDLERIAPCMPGAQLLEVDGDEYRGVVKVKVGPITAQYKGTARMVERDDVAHRAVLRAEGREARGQGNAAATVTAVLEERPGGTDVHIATELEISGKVAQFGRGVLGEVSEKLLGQFVRELEENVLLADATDDAAASGAPEATGKTASSDEAAEAAENEAAPTPSGPRLIDSPEAQPVDLLDAAGGSMAKRFAPVAVVLAIVLILRRRRRRRS
jgi:carbon monoxide dehydrogenase subunit G